MQTLPVPFSDIHFILHHDDPDGGLAALVLRRAIQQEAGRIVPLSWADYRNQVANDLNEIEVADPHVFTVDVRLFPGVPGMDHHDTSEAWFDPTWHILDLSAPSCFSLMLDRVGRRDDWPENVVQHIDWMDSGAYPSVELAVGLEQLGQQFIAIYEQLPHEAVLAELWRDPDAEAFVRRHGDIVAEVRRFNEKIREDMAARGRIEGRVAIWDSSALAQERDINAVNPFLLCAVFPQADYTIRMRPDGHMTVGHNPWGQPNAHMGHLCETLVDPASGVRGGGKAQVGGAPATPETVRKAISVLNDYNGDRGS